MATIGRNDPCPCGSGKKYKKCCLSNQQEQRPRTHPAHEADRSLTEKLWRFANRTRGAGWVEDEIRLYVDCYGTTGDESLEAAWAVPLTFYHRDGELERTPTVLQEFLEHEGHRLSPAERALARAHQQAWASLWEVVEVRAGQGIRLRDLLIGCERDVHELSLASESCLGLVFLARVLDLEDASILVGVHPAPLSRRWADHVRKQLLAEFPCPNRDELRHEDCVLLLNEQWRNCVRDSRNAPPPTVVNTEGDELVFLSEEFVLPADRRDELLTILGEQAEVELEEPADGAVRGRFLTPAGNARSRTVLASFKVGPEVLVLDTNSERRSRTFHERLLELAPWLTARERVRDHLPARLSRTPARRVRAPLPEEALRALREIRLEHMHDWKDTPVPALEGETPRHAARDPRLRPRLESLIAQMQASESRLPLEQRIDLGPLVEELLAAPVPLRELPVNLEALIAAIEDSDHPDRVYFLDTQAGEVVRLDTDLVGIVGRAIDDQEIEDWTDGYEPDEVALAVAVTRDEHGRYVGVDSANSPAGLRRMLAFARSASSPVRPLLEAALNHRQATREFHQVLQSHPEDRERWAGYCRVEREDEALEWLARLGLSVGQGRSRHSKSEVAAMS